MEEHLGGTVEPQYHLCPSVGPFAHQPCQDAGGSQQELLWPPSLPLTRAIDTHLLLIGVDSSSGVRKEEASFPRPRCPMYGPKPSRILPSQAWPLLGLLVHLLLRRADDHGQTGLGRAGGCLGALWVAEMGTARLVSHLCRISDAQEQCSGISSVFPKVQEKGAESTGQATAARTRTRVPQDRLQCPLRVCLHGTVQGCTAS